MINRWSYINGYAMVFPKGFEKSRKIGAGSIVVEEDYTMEEDYTIYFTPDTPEDLKHRFVREYAEYHAQKMEERRQGIYIDY